MELKVEHIETDFLVLGGGTAGCYAALTFSARSAAKVLIAEKANIKRSGCLAAGVNALNAYITTGHTPQDYVDYARTDAAGIVRGDLLISMSRGLNRAAQRLEEIGLTIQKNPDGSYMARGERNIKINGENIKPLLAAAVAKPQVTVLERVAACSYIMGADKRVAGAYLVGVDDPVLYVISARAVLCATGGAAGLYRPNNPGFSGHKMWYPPFNTGAGLAMGIQAGAEMTSLEMRFVALRCKDTIAPTGTLAQGMGARQINSLGRVYEQDYGLSTSARLYGTITENLEGRGPCFLRTVGATSEQDAEIEKAYLNMAPSQTLRWLESGLPPSQKNVEIEGTEPYIVGGHTASGYWVDTHRETTLKCLFAAGDVAGGCPQKYVTGALAEAEIATEAAISYMSDELKQTDIEQTQRIKVWLESHLMRTMPETGDTVDGLEEEMQALMDEQAGGITSNYQYSQASLEQAAAGIYSLSKRAKALSVPDMPELTYLLELRERLIVCRSLLAHLAARKESRWPGFAKHADYPEQDDSFRCYVNSKLEDGKVKVLFRDLVEEGEVYEHHDR
ncbi:MAG: adenylyl-sulfate reductase subunit alpha [Actinomycetia bacterium]|nr:adenylyl-sulfate reductase subunit alpha [Actinomycetes bacterium]